MKPIIASSAIWIVLATVLLVPAITKAQQNTPNTQQISQETLSPADVPQYSITTEDCETTLCNPLKGVDSIGGLIFKVLDFFYGLSYVVIAAFLIWAGFKFVIAQGSEDKLTDAKTTFWYTIIGAALLIGANVITQVVKSLIDNFRS